MQREVGRADGEAWPAVECDGLRQLLATANDRDMARRRRSCCCPAWFAVSVQVNAASARTATGDDAQNAGVALAYVTGRAASGGRAERMLTVAQCAMLPAEGNVIVWWPCHRPRMEGRERMVDTNTHVGRRPPKQVISPVPEDGGVGDHCCAKCDCPVLREPVVSA